MNIELPGLQLPPLPHVVVSWFLNTSILSVILALFALGYIIVSAVLFYHWAKYGMRHAGILVARALFTFVSLLFFGFAITALYYY